ncbi:MAG TPA: hypothetical protein PLJ21_08680 [Pseudobdellovibrionaceae bacterium]|nr:hypothetical protein [Pseudobdellovibrionaceae bacterium]
MLHTALQFIKKNYKIKLKFFIILTSFFVLNACISKSIEPKPILTERVFFKPYDEIWKAVHGVIKYPIAVENYDAGVIETEYIPATEGWKAPTTQIPISMGVKFKLIFRVSKGSIDNTPSSKVNIEKEILIKRDFVSDPEPLASDKLEELSLIYRIDRELQILSALKQAGLTN